jgi:hypothetical protein
MAYTFVQAANAGVAGATATSLDLTFGAAVTAGSLVVIMLSWDSANVNLLTSVTDTAGNTYTIRQRLGSASAYAYAYNVTAFTVATANFGSAIGYRGMSGQEFSSSIALSTDPFEADQGRFQSAVGTGTDGATSGAGALTPAANNALVWCGIANMSAAGSGANYVTAGTNFTEPAGAEHQVSSEVVISSEYNIQTTATARNGSWTSTANNDYVTTMAIFAEPGAAPPGGDIRLLVSNDLAGLVDMKDMRG